jgi:hypothetical protein
MTLWHRWDDILKLTLVVGLLIVGGMWTDTRRELERERAITLESRIAGAYCSSVKRDVASWKQTFQHCYDDVLKNPLMGAVGLYGSK